MSSENLGKIENVDLRSIWPNEAIDFTPWLEQHVSELGDAVGINLKIVRREAPVGSYSLDLLAHDEDRDCPVIIENQLETTNHDHLGKLLTYASGYDAGTVIWLAKEIREEHRQALDWLNQRTDEGTEFFGVVVELLKIDNSRPAPNFKLVAFPNEWRKMKISSASTPELSRRAELFRNYFSKLIIELHSRHNIVGPRGTPTSGYRSFRSEVNGASYFNQFLSNGQVRVVLNIANTDVEENQRIFDLLQNEKVSLEASFCEPLEWEGRADRQNAYYIYTSRQGNIEDSPEILGEITEWTIERLAKLKQVFDPRLAELMEQM